MKQIFDLSSSYYYIVDTSYIIFCSAASAFKNYVYQEDIPKTKLGHNFDPTQDQEFNYIFEKTFKNKIENTVKSVIPFSFDRSKFIFSIDCPRKEIWRRSIYPEYKIQRDTCDHSKDEFDIGAVFKYAYTFTIPNYCDEHRAIIIGSPGAESDDIIAVLSKYILNKSENNKLIILSSDRDMVQLCNDRTTIISTRNEIRSPKIELMTMTKAKSLPDDLTSDDFLLFKILIGDGSDNIPAIKYRLGPKTAIKYILDKSHNMLKQLFKEDINIVNSFKRNMKLISMDKIPQDVENLIVEEIKLKLKDQPSNKPVIESIDNIDDLLS